MSSTVTYKGSTIATVNNATVTLETSGTWMEDDVTIVDVTSGGTSYQAEYEELRGIIDGTVTVIDNSTITAFRTGLLFQGANFTSMNFRSMTTAPDTSVFKGCTSLTTAVFPVITGTARDMFWNCSALTKADFGALTSMNNYTFENCSSLDTVIIRSSAVATLANSNAFNGTPFASGGTGGTIYVPSALISSYQSASGWATVDGWGTVTWAAIEGSAYETAYADGSAIE